MPACGQCGKQNPEGTVFCGHCAASLAAPVAAPPKPAEPTPSTPKPESVLKHEIRQQAPPKVLKPEPRPIPVRAAPASGESKGGFELMPWSELSQGQRAGRVAAGVVVVLVIFLFARGILRMVGGSNQSASSQEGADGPITDIDRKDGIESLCKVFQIYGIPNDEKNAAGSAKNAAEMFKLADDQSPERSRFILSQLAGEFRTGKLSEQDCAEAGAPLAKVGSPRAGSTPSYDEAKHAFYY